MSQIIVHVQQKKHPSKVESQLNLPSDSDLSTAERVDEKWQQHLAKAKMSWEILTEQELIKSRGSARKLAGLVRQRYSLSHVDTENQVNAFLKKNSSSIK